MQIFSTNWSSGFLGQDCWSSFEQYRCNEGHAAAGKCGNLFFLLLSSLYSFLISIALNKIISLGEASRDTEDDDGNVT